jgi:hypothetical protein
VLLKDFIPDPNKIFEQIKELKEKYKKMIGFENFEEETKRLI